VRWPNLVFIILTQVLFHYCIIHATLDPIGQAAVIHGGSLVLIIIASVLIAAAGNIINDYFDLNIDQVNKPDKMVVEKVIKRRWVILWHLVLSAAGILLSFYVGWKLRIYWLGLANFGCVVLLFFYSMSLKKQFLAGNILVSVLTAWVILVLAFSETRILAIHSSTIDAAYRKIFRLGIVYGGFAFIISLIREVVKDMEDVQGDRRYGCKTMPIVWGLNSTKVFVAVWLIVLIAALAIIQVYVLQFGWWFSALYCVLFVIIPLVWIFKKLFTAQTPPQFHELSSAIKIVMLTGILSMLFFKLYA